MKKYLLLILGLVFSAASFADGLSTPVGTLGLQNANAVAITGGSATFTGLVNNYGHNALSTNSVYGGVLSAITTGDRNTVVGIEALRDTTSGVGNTSIGYRALVLNADGAANTVVGFNSGFNNSSGSNNTVLGEQAFYENTTGSNNTAIGGTAGSDGTTLTTNSNCTFIGYQAISTVNNLTNCTALGNGAQATASNQVVIGNASVTQTRIRGLQTTTAEADSSYSIQTPSTGFSITIGNTVGRLLLNPAGTLATGTITLPASPANDGQIARACTTQIITALTVSPSGGQTIAGTAPTTLTANGCITYLWNLSGTQWYPAN
jgi:hypothetical protein